MTLSKGQRLGAYEIRGPLGAGGMGEVYRARDTRLDRDVAVKVLPAALREHPEALARFEREAKAVAALSHPNIMAIHDVGEEQGVNYAVAELLEGGTLRDAVKDGPLPPRTAVEYARMVANGLAAAHDGGIVHRDLKPENLFVTRDGRVKILDFGLARTDDTQDTAPDDTPTRTQLTMTDSVMGTLNYMSPEQTRGETAGPASDIFSLGSVLFEMLTGERPFARETAPETMTAIMREDPPAFASTTVPPAVQRIVLRCLEKRPEQRFQSASDLAFALEFSSEVSSGVATTAAAAHPERRGRRGLWFAALPALVAGLVVGAVLTGLFDRAPHPPPVKVVPVTFSGTQAHPASSPDGSTIAFAALRGGSPGIWIKQLDGGGEAPLTNGNDMYPRFSPDGTALLFARVAETRPGIYRIPRVGGAPRKIIENAHEADWSPDGTRIVFVRNLGPDEMLGIANADGSGERTLVTRPSRRLLSPRWSPDGKQIAVVDTAANNNLPLAVSIIDVESGEVRTLEPERPSISGLAWVGSGEELLYAWSEDLLSGMGSTAARFSVVDARTGASRDLFWANYTLWNQYGTRLDIVDDGRVVFGTIGMAQGLREVAPGGASDDAIRLLTDGNSVDRQPVYSPDGKTVLFSSNRGGHLDLWTVDVETGATAQLTDDAASDWDPAYVGDGRKIVWSSDRGGNLEIWIANADGSGARQLTQDGVDAENPTATPDGEWIAYATSNPKNVGIWMIRADGSDAKRVYEGSVYTPQISPDGLRIAFPGNSSDGAVYLNVLELSIGKTAQVTGRLRGPSASSMISIGRPRWFDGGRSLAFVGFDDGEFGVYAQEFAPGQDTKSTRRKLTGFDPEWSVESFDISPDGTRVALSRYRPQGTVMLAEGVPFVTPPEGRGE